MDDQCLSVKALPRIVGQLVNLKRGNTGIVEQVADLYLQNFSALDRQLAHSAISDLEALETALFDSGLKPDLYDKQRFGAYCTTLIQACDRARHNAEHEKYIRIIFVPQFSIVARHGRAQSSTGHTFCAKSQPRRQSQSQHTQLPLKITPCTNPACIERKKHRYHSYNIYWKHPRPVKAERNQKASESKREVRKAAFSARKRGRQS